MAKDEQGRYRAKEANAYNPYRNYAGRSLDGELTTRSQKGGWELHSFEREINLQNISGSDYEHRKAAMVPRNYECPSCRAEGSCFDTSSDFDRH